MEMTQEIAMAAAMDAANRNMMIWGRQKWNFEDQNIAIREYNRLLPPTESNRGDEND